MATFEPFVLKIRNLTTKVTKDYTKDFVNLTTLPIRDEIIPNCRFSINIKSLPGLKKLNLNSLFYVASLNFVS